MTPLQLRKQLLVTESELNRAQITGEWQKVAEDSRAILDRARSVTSMVLGAASLISGLAFLRRTRSAAAGAKTSWWQTVMKGAQLAASLWSEFRVPPKP